MRKQIVALGSGFCILWIFNIIYLCNKTRLYLNLASLSLAFSGILLIWILFRYSFFQVTPAALEKILESMADGIVVLDFRNQIIDYNKPAGIIIPELKGITSKQKNSAVVFTNYPIITEALKQNITREMQFTLPREGDFKIYKMRLSLVTDKKCVLGKIVVLTDITVIEKNRDKLTATSAQLVALNVLKDKLISIVANDIQKPLNRLINLSCFLEKQEHRLEEHEPGKFNKKLLAGEIQKQVKSIFSIVDNMLEAFQNKQTSIIYSPMEWKLSPLVQEAINTISEKAVNKNISIKFDLPDHLFVFADRGMLDIVLRNLFSNAVKFTNRNGNITVSARKEENYVIISIKDTGVGMKPEKIQMLFQDVECSPAAGTEGEGGIGVGLLLCRQIIQQNHGDIWVDSTFGEGSNFFISVPASDGRIRK